MLRRILSTLIIATAVVPAVAIAVAPSADMRSATVFIANYNRRGDFVGWGSGFYVDDGIVVTNNHVVEDGQTYRVFATGANDDVDLECSTKISRSDVRINLNDDVAYMRVYLPCDHGVLSFADDPEDGAPLAVIGYPFRGSVSNSLSLKITTGVVTGTTDEGWLTTDAALDLGNSGGPVVGDDGVLGVAVAKSVDKNGNFVTGYFIPSTVIYNGLVYANDGSFGYSRSGSAPSSRSSAASSSVESSSSGIASSMSSSSSSQSSSSPSSVVSSRSSSSAPPTADDLRRERICLRVQRAVERDPKLGPRLEARLEKRFGFRCEELGA